MTSWTLILCEGAHDAAALAALASGCANWEMQHGVPKALPARLQAAFPIPTVSKAGAYLHEPTPKYLSNGDRILEIRPLGGAENVLGEPAKDLLDQFNPDGVGVVVDADDKGVDSRVESFRNRFSDYPHASKVGAGDVVDGEPRLGLWVAPNNRDKGRMDELILKAAARTDKELITCGKRFVTSLEGLKPGKWIQKRDKAILGAVGQAALPGASLASVLNAQKFGWFSSDLKDVPPFRELLQFIERLAAPT